MKKKIIDLKKLRFDRRIVTELTGKQQDRVKGGRVTENNLSRCFSFCNGHPCP